VRNVLYHVIYKIPEQVIPGLWHVDALGRPGMAVVALMLTALLLLACLRRLWLVLPMLALIVPQAVMQVFYAWGGSPRFWVPVTTVMLVMLAMSLAPSLQRWRLGWGMQAGLVAACAANLVFFIVKHERAPSILDYADLMRLYEMARDIPDRPRVVLTEHAPLYAFITGDEGSRPLQPWSSEFRYDGMTVRDGKGGHTYNLSAPPGAREVARAGAWRLLALPEPMSDAELFRRFQQKP
jgi:hypothetical protein